MEKLEKESGLQNKRKRDNQWITVRVIESDDTQKFNLVRASDNKRVDVSSVADFIRSVEEATKAPKTKKSICRNYVP